MNKRTFSPEQDEMIRNLLACKSGMSEALLITRRLDLGQMSFEEADDAIRLLGGIGPATDFWDRFYPKGGATIAMKLEQYLNLRPVGPPLSTIEAFGYKAIVDPSQHVRISVDLCPLGACHKAESLIKLWFDEYLRAELEKLASEGCFIRRGAEGAGAVFLQRVPHVNTELIFFEDVPSEYMSGRLQTNFSTALSVAAAACYFQKEELRAATYHALNLFRNGNPIAGFTSDGALLIVADVHNEKRQPTQPRHTIPSLTPIPPPLHPTPMPASSPDNILS